MSDGTCCICAQPLGSTRVGCGGDKWAHQLCYTVANPPRAVESLYLMARGQGDPVLAAEVIAEMVPPELAAQIVAVFNRRLVAQWEWRCRVYAGEEPPRA